MSHVTILGMGTCGDLQPLGALARALRERGHEVQFLTIPDYEDLVHPYGVPFVPVGPRLDDLVRRPEFDRLISQKFEISNFWRCARILREAMYEILEDVVRKVTATDIVVFNPIACFGTHLARSLNVPSLRVLAQPMLPSWKEPCSLWMSSGAFPGPINRVSYEVGRLMLLAFNLNRPVGGRKIRIGRWFNPLTDALDESAQLLAASGSLCGNPGDWPAAVEAAGFWFQQPAPGETLPDELQSFLSAGPAPLYVGFGSMNWNAKAITDKVLTALREWGGRAVLGAGGFTPDAELPPNVFRGGIVSHTLLFPHVSGVVHHGGAGTSNTGAAGAGRPDVLGPSDRGDRRWAGPGQAAQDQSRRIGAAVRATD